MTAKTIVVLATLDTKGREAQYLREQIEVLGSRALVMDSGVVGRPACRADITREEVAAAGGTPLAKLLEHPDRGGGRAGHGRGRHPHRAAVGRRGQGARHRVDGRHAGHHPQHPGDARPALRFSQGDGLHHGLRQRRAVGGHPGHHHDVLGDRHHGPQPDHAQDPGQRRRCCVRHGQRGGADRARSQAAGRRSLRWASPPRVR